MPWPGEPDLTGRSAGGHRRREPCATENLSSRVLLALRRSIGVPPSRTAWYVYGAHPPGDTAFRVRLNGPGHPAEPVGSLLVGLPLPASTAEDRGWRWYVGALRRITRLISETGSPLAYGDDGVAVVDAAVLGQEGFPDEPEVTLEGGVDYVVGDPCGDALWHETPASAAPGLYRMVGFDLAAGGGTTVR